MMILILVMVMMTIVIITIRITTMAMTTTCSAMLIESQCSDCYSLTPFIIIPTMNLNLFNSSSSHFPHCSQPMTHPFPHVFFKPAPTFELSLFPRLIQPKTGMPFVRNSKISVFTCFQPGVVVSR